MTQVHKELGLIVDSFLNGGELSTIWEIGSRDGKDSEQLSKIFSDAAVMAFEPNPDTYGHVEEVAKNSHGKIKAMNLALSNVDGEVVFYKIDTEKTTTTWLDGNPGASSLFMASGNYCIENYVQIPIQVQAKKASTLIDDLGFVIPELIWMDVQGSEGLVIQGFSEHISKVNFIYVELSLQSIYVGQPLAQDILKLLSSNFYWHSNLSKGPWQIDALFVNKNLSTTCLKIRNLLLVLSLKTVLIGIKYSFTHAFKSSIRRFLRFILFKKV
jgi:FkbM family methyltransferase